MDFIHTNLRFLRKRKGFTQEELAMQLQTKRSLIGAYEEGRAKPNYDLLRQISELFQISIDHLITADLRQMEKVPLFSEEQLKNGTIPMKVLAITVDEKQNENIEIVPVKAAAQRIFGSVLPERAEPLPAALSSQRHLPGF